MTPICTQRPPLLAVLWLLGQLSVSCYADAPPEPTTRQPQPLPPVDAYGVIWSTPSTSSLGAMPVGNGRTSANVWVEARTGDLLLNLGLMDALDENSNLLKLGRVRLRVDPPLVSSAGTESAATFTQTLVLSTGTIEIRRSGPEPSEDGVIVNVWVDAASSAVRVSVAPTGTATATVAVVAVLENWRLAGPIDAANYGNGWGGSGGSFCNSNGTIADHVYIFPDTLMAPPVSGDGPATVAWYHRNHPSRADFFGDAMREQGLGSLVGDPEVSDPLTNRTWGAGLTGVGDASASTLRQINATAIGSVKRAAGSIELTIAVYSAQTPTAEEFVTGLQSSLAAARATPAAVARAAHVAWWTDFFNRSYIRLTGNDNTTRLDVHTDPAIAAATAAGTVDGITPRDDLALNSGRSYTASPATPPPLYRRYNGTAGDQRALMSSPSWPADGKSPGTCTVPFPSPLCIQEAAHMCSGIFGCKSYAFSLDWHGGLNPQVFTDGFPSAEHNPAWTLFDNTAKPPSPPPPPPLPPPSSSFLVSRQAVLMRYMDLCSSGRLGGGADNSQFFALKYNGGILTAEPSPKEDSRAWVSGLVHGWLGQPMVPR